MILPLLIAITLAGPIPGDDWPRYAHDGALTGRSPLKGEIREPHVAWTYSTAGRDLTVEFAPATGQQQRVIPATGDVPADGPAQLKLPGAEMRDLDGTGTLHPAYESHHERWAKVLPNVRGLQRCAWSNTWTDNKDGRLQLFAYDAGFDKPRRVWESEPEQNPLMTPLNVIYDIDGDGTPEILVAAHYRAMVFDGTTGKKRTDFQYQHGRPYGWFGIADVDGDGTMELITIGDFQSHIDVVKYDRTKPDKDRLSVLWQREVCMDIADRDKWLQIGPHPVADVTGDSRPEIILNLFGDTGDNEWHVVVLDAANGKTICDIPKQFLQGVADVDGDGKAELFVGTVNGMVAPTFSRVELIKVREGRAEVFWSKDNAAWVMADIARTGPTWTTSATQGRQQVLVSEEARPTFVLREIKESTSAVNQTPITNTLIAMRCDAKGKPQTAWQVEGLIGQVDGIGLARVDGADVSGATVRLHIPANLSTSMTAIGVKPRIVTSSTFGVPQAFPIAARLKPNGPMTIVVEGAGQNLFAIRPPLAAGESPHLLWQRPGRSMANGGHILSPLAADLDDDGGCEIIAADQAPLGHAKLIAYRYDGTPYWEKSFERTNGGPPVGNVGALLYWWPGKFRSPDHNDLFVNTRRNMMHSDTGYLLDGKDGHEVWHKDKAVAPGVFSWGYAGTPVAITDVDGDKLDELASLYPVEFWIAKGKDGSFIAAKEMASGKVIPTWAAYGEPMIYDLLGDGKLKVLMCSPYILAMLDLQGNLVWFQTPSDDRYLPPPHKSHEGEVTTSRQTLVDFDGDGKMEIAAGGYKDGVHATDPRDGKIVWHVDAPMPTCDKAVAADIDGRKGDELLYVANDTLIAITGDRTAGRILWTWKGPAALSAPAIADLNGEGHAQIVMQAANGTVVCLK